VNVPEATKNKINPKPKYKSWTGLSGSDHPSPNPEIETIAVIQRAIEKLPKKASKMTAA